MTRTVWRGVWTAGVLAALAACGGGGGGGGGEATPGGTAAPVRITGPTVLEPEVPTQWRVDMPAQPADDPPTGYRITLSEAAADLDIRTQPCPQPAATGCQLWTLLAGPAALPGRWQIGVEPVGQRAAVADTVMLNFELRRTPQARGDAVDVAFDGATLLVMTQDGRLWGRGDNSGGQIGGSLSGLDGFVGSTRPHAVQPHEVTAFAPIDGDVALPRSGRGVAVAGGRVWMRGRLGGNTTLQARGANLDGGLGVPDDAAQSRTRLTPATLSGLGDVGRITSGGLGVVLHGTFGSGATARRGLYSAGRAPAPGVGPLPITLDGSTPIADARMFAGGQWQGPPVLVVLADGSLRRWSAVAPGPAAPVQGLPEPLQAVSVAGRVGLHTVPAYALALTEGGSVWWWRLGSGSDPDGTPQRVPGLDAVVHINAGARAWAVRRDGTLWHWDPQGAAAPAPVPGLAQVRQVVDGYAITEACPQGRGALWRIEVDEGGARALREAGFGSLCPDGATANLRIEIEGSGRVVSVPVGTECTLAVCTHVLTAPASLQLRAVADAGHVLAAVEGDCARQGLDEGALQLDLDAGASALCRVRFVATERQQVLLSVEGPGHVRWGSSRCPQDCRYEGDLPELQLQAEADGGARFVAWSGDCSGNEAGHRLDLAGDGRSPRQPVLACTARFEAVPVGVLTPNLLVDPGFESTRPAAAGVPAAAGRWQGDASETEVVGNRFGIEPHGGIVMQRFVATGAISSTNTVAGQMWQLVDLQAWAEAIDAGQVRADARVWFNRVAGHAATDRRFDLRLLAFDGTAAGVPARYAANTALAQRTVSLDSAPQQWQRVEAQLALPPLTRWLLFEIYAFEDVRNDNEPPEFDGHFADDAELVLVRP